MTFNFAEFNSMPNTAADEAPIRLGFIGMSLKNTSAIKTHYPAILQLSAHFEISAIYNKDINASTQIVKKLKLENASTFDSLESFVTLSNVNMIIVTLHEERISDIILELLDYCQYAKNLQYIFLEWPINCSLKEAEIIVKAASELGIQTIVSLQGRKSPYILRAKELISEGSIGEINSIEVAGNAALFGYERSIKSPDYLYEMRNGTDMISNSFGHTIDILQYITGSYFSKINAMVFNNIPEQELVDENGVKTGEKVRKDVPDHLMFQGYLTKGNVPVSCTFKGGSPMKKFTKNLVIDIHGTKGDVKLEGDVGFIEISNLVLYYDGIKVNRMGNLGDKVKYDAEKEVMEFYHLRNYNALTGNMLRLYQSIADFHFNVKRFNNLPTNFIMQGFETEGFPTVTDALVLYRLLNSVMESHMQGKTVDVSNIYRI